MHNVELFIALLAGVLCLVSLAEPLRVPYPVLLVLGGLAVGLLPFLPDVRMEPGFVLLAFLPPILYRASFSFAGEDVRMQWGAIAALAIGLVLLTIGAVALVAHALTGLPWQPAFVLGAILGPTDPVAATAVIRRLGAPERMATILEGESMVNDGTGLTAFRIAIGVTASHAFHAAPATLQFLGVGLGGLALGAAIGWAATVVRRRLEAAELEIVAALVTAYAAYAASERLGVSGILAVVAAGFVVGRAPSVTTPQARMHAQAFWRTLAFVAESVLFLLVGLAVAHVLDHGRIPLGRVAVDSLLVAATCMAVRLAWMYTVPYAAARIDRRIAGAQPITDRRERLLLGVSGMRGAVSVAAALAIPAGNPSRDTVLLVTCGAVLLTLVPSSVALPKLLCRLGLGQDDALRRRYVDARVKVAHAALDRVHALDEADQAPEELLLRAREAYELRIARLEHELDDQRDGGASASGYRRLRQALVDAEREALEELSAAHEVRGGTLRRIRRELDLDTTRLQD